MDSQGVLDQYSYDYDALNRLVQEETWENRSLLPEAASSGHGPSMEAVTQKSYAYDQRGNLSGEYQDGELLHGYAFNAMNRMEKAWDNTGKEAEYFYNGLGQRTGRTGNDKMEGYLLDLTRPYHNLLAVKSGEERVNYYWDSGVAAMEEQGRAPRYYLQDELGSPLRVLYGTGNGDAYGYDEFGRDMHDPGNEEAGRYSRQGGKQPFGYTGYRHDEISGTYFAQAREYRAELGRFTAEDVVRGNGAVPQTMNRYSYCWNQPLHFVDGNGREPENSMDFNIQPLQPELLFPDITEKDLPNTTIKYPEVPFPDIVIKDPVDPFSDVTIGPPTGEFTPIVKKNNIINISVEVGTGLYADFDIAGIGAEVGVKNYLSYNNQGKYFFTHGMQLSAGLNAFIVGGSGGYQYVTYPMLDMVEKEGWFTDYNFFSFSEENGDYIFSIGTSLYVAIGGGLQIDINVSKAWREIKKEWNKQVNSINYCSE